MALPGNPKLVLEGLKTALAAAGVQNVTRNPLAEARPLVLLAAVDSVPNVTEEGTQELGLPRVWRHSCTARYIHVTAERRADLPALADAAIDGAWDLMSKLVEARDPVWITGIRWIEAEADDWGRWMQGGEVQFDTIEGG